MAETLWLWFNETKKENIFLDYGWNIVIMVQWDKKELRIHDIHWFILRAKYQVWHDILDDENKGTHFEFSE
jgi:hypothetical protein